MKGFLKFKRKQSQYNVQPISTLDFNKMVAKLYCENNLDMSMRFLLLSCKSLTPNKSYSTTNFPFSPRKSDGISYPGQLS